MINYITYLNSNINTILYEWYQGQLKSGFEPDIKYVTIRKHPVTRENIAVYYSTGYQWQPLLHNEEVPIYNEIDKNTGLPGTWEPIVIEICINTKGEVVDVEVIFDELVIADNTLMSFSKPEVQGKLSF